MANSLNTAGLQWTKSDLDALIVEVRQHIQSHLEDEAGLEALREASKIIHHAAGVLFMLEQKTAHMLVKEIELLLIELGSGKWSGTPKQQQGVQVVVQAVLQVPDYLEYLLNGYKDVPELLLPLINAMRELREVKKINESQLFSPDLASAIPAPAPLRLYQDDAAVKSRAEYMRALFQGYLLRWLKNDEPEEALDGLLETCEQLTAISHNPSARHLFWVAGACFDGLRDQKLEFHIHLKHTLAKVEREIKKLALGGHKAFNIEPADELTTQLLYFLANDLTNESLEKILDPKNPDPNLVARVHRHHRLHEQLARKDDLEKARAFLSGRNKALIDAVIKIVKEDMMQVKDALDLFLRKIQDEHTNDKEIDNQTLIDQNETLHRIAETLAMVGLVDLRNEVHWVKNTLSDTVKSVTERTQSGQNLLQAWRVDDVKSQLLDVASGILMIENNIDRGSADLIKRQNSFIDIDTQTALAKEAVVNIGKAKSSILLFIDARWDHSKLTEIPDLINEVAGALAIMNAGDVVPYFNATSDYVKRELLGKKKIPSRSEIEHVADVMVCLEYFVEALRDQEPHTDRILELVKQSLTALGQSVSPAAPVAVDALPPAASPEQSAPKPAAPEQAPASVNATPVQPAPTPIPAPAAQQPLTQQMLNQQPAIQDQSSQLEPIEPFDGVNTVELDDDIKDIFLEELDEEMTNIEQWVGALVSDSGNQKEIIKDIRKSFHTIKGSGRMIGAKSLGELSWRLENVLNKVIEGRRPMSKHVVACVSDGFEMIKDYQKAIKGEPKSWKLKEFLGWSDALIAGEDIPRAAFSPSEPPTKPVAAPVPQDTPKQIPTPAAAPAAASVEISPISPPVHDDADLDLALDFDASNNQNNIEKDKVEPVFAPVSHPVSHDDAPLVFDQSFDLTPIDQSSDQPSIDLEALEISDQLEVSNQNDHQLTLGEPTPLEKQLLDQQISEHPLDLDVTDTDLSAAEFNEIKSNLSHQGASNLSGHDQSAPTSPPLGFGELTLSDLSLDEPVLPPKSDDAADPALSVSSWGELSLELIDDQPSMDPPKNFALDDKTIEQPISQNNDEFDVALLDTDQLKPQRPADLVDEITVDGDHAPSINLEPALLNVSDQNLDEKDLSQKDLSQKDLSQEYQFELDTVDHHPRESVSSPDQLVMDEPAVFEHEMTFDLSVDQALPDFDEPQPSVEIPQSNQEQSAQSVSQQPLAAPVSSPPEPQRLDIPDWDGAYDIASSDWRVHVLYLFDIHNRIDMLSFLWSEHLKNHPNAVSLQVFEELAAHQEQIETVLARLRDEVENLEKINTQPALKSMINQAIATTPPGADQAKSHPPKTPSAPGSSAAQKPTQPSPPVSAPLPGQQANQQAKREMEQRLQQIKKEPEKKSWWKDMFNKK